VSNYLRTTMLMAALLGVLLAIGNYLGGARGMLAWGAIGLLFNFGAYWFSDRIALAVNRARPVSRDELPQVYEIVEELTSRAGLPMPRIYLIPSASPNAFATGRNPSHAAVAVTAGILEVLDRRELRAVLAHELSHVKNRDILIGSIAAAVAGLISAVGTMLRWGFLLAGGRGDERRGSPLGDLAIAILAPIVAVIIQLAISRSREYGADWTGGVLAEDPEALASALERIHMASRVRPYEYAGPATAHLFIVNPLTGSWLTSLLSTHPPVEKRIERLHALAARLGGGYRESSPRQF
jgi:heat shock protein HtpX